jgi:16S rRNA processing protein RimM
MLAPSSFSQVSSPSSRKRGTRGSSSLDPRFREDDIRGMNTEDAVYFCAAIITSPHGIHGHVKIKCFLEDPADFKMYSPYHNENGEETYRVTKVLSQNKDMLIVTLEDIKDRNQAERLKGAKLMLAREHLPDLEQDTFYHADLIGLDVLSSVDKAFGKVHALYNFGAGDILEVETTQSKLVMIPFTHDIVPDVDMKKGFVRLSTIGDTLVKGESDGA